RSPSLCLGRTYQKSRPGMPSRLDVTCEASASALSTYAYSKRLTSWAGLSSPGGVITVAPGNWWAYATSAVAYGRHLVSLIPRVRELPERRSKDSPAKRGGGRARRRGGRRRPTLPPVSPQARAPHLPLLEERRRRVYAWKGLNARRQRIHTVHS